MIKANKQACSVLQVPVIVPDSGKGTSSFTSSIRYMDDVMDNFNFKTKRPSENHQTRTHVLMGIVGNSEQHTGSLYEQAQLIASKPPYTLASPDPEITLGTGKPADGLYHVAKSDLGGNVKEFIGNYLVPPVVTKQYCNYAFQAFRLNNYGLDPKIIIGTVNLEETKRNQPIKEQVEAIADTIVRISGWMSEGQSIGRIQMQVGNIRALVHAFPHQLGHMNADPLRAALDPKNQALLVAAYYAQKIKLLEQHKQPITPDPNLKESVRKEVNKAIIMLWKSGDPRKMTDAVIRTYNPGAGQQYVDEVRNEMMKVHD